MTGPAKMLLLMALPTLVGVVTTSLALGADGQRPTTVQEFMDRACPREGWERAWSLTGRLVAEGVTCLDDKDGQDGPCQSCRGTWALVGEGPFRVILSGTTEWSSRDPSRSCEVESQWPLDGPVTVRGRLRSADLPWSLFAVGRPPTLVQEGPPTPAMPGSKAIPVDALPAVLCQFPAHPVTVQGVLDVAVLGCTKMRCPPSNPCCNLCTGIPVLRDPGQIHGMDLAVAGVVCVGSECGLTCGNLVDKEGYQATGVVDVTAQQGRLTMQVQDLQRLRDVQR